ncbi:MAG: M55 family metallopeptidase [Myxococcales bacterium]|nr:M55 family metallopeptidase [Myxococcales bacterium]
MRVYISIDMEGVAGVVHADQCRRGADDYPAACALMTGEADAAAKGAFDAGAEVVLINDSHGDMRNLDLGRLDPRVEVLSGSLKRFSMAEGLDGGGFDLALFIGYHAGAGTQRAILDHTYRSTVAYAVRVNGRPINEAALNALVAGAAGTPVGLVSGDETTCAQCRALLGEVDTVAVKSAVGRLAARSLHPERARAQIRAAAAKAVRERYRFRPFHIDPPYSLEIDTVTTAMADAGALMPGALRSGDRTLRFDAGDVQTLFRALLALLRLAGTGV